MKNNLNINTISIKFIFIAILFISFLKVNNLTSSQYSLESSFSQVRHSPTKAKDINSKYELESDLNIFIVQEHSLYSGSYIVNSSTGTSVENKLKLASENLLDAHVYPNPCKVYEGNNYITFTNLTKDALIKIYTISGNLVQEITKSGVLSDIKWDLNNDRGESVASGIYIYVIKSGNMMQKGKIVVIK